MSMSKTNIQFATFMERLKPTFMDYIGPWLLFFVGAFVQTPIAGIGIFGIILGVFCELLAIIALLFINGYAPALNRGFTPNKMTHGVRLMKIVNKDTMELREVDEGDMGILLLRAIIGWFEAFLFLPIVPGILALLIINSSATNQRIADLVAGTVVIKVEPVEKVNIKDFRMKKSDPSPTFDGISSIQTTGKSKKKQIDKKLDKKFDDGIFSKPTFIVVGKWIIISSSIYLILAQIVKFVSRTLRLVNTSFKIFGEEQPIGNTGSELHNVLTIIGYVVLFICCSGFVLYYLGIRNTKTKKPLIISGILYLFFIIFRIVFIETIWNGKMIAIIDYGFGYDHIQYNGVGYGGFVFQIVSTVCLILSLIFLSKFVMNFNAEHQTNIRKNFGQISLIVFFSLFFVTLFIGLIADAEETTVMFSTVIFYIRRLFEICLVFVYLGIYAKLIKLRKIAKVNNVIE